MSVETKIDFNNLHFDNEIDVSPFSTNPSSPKTNEFMPNVNFLGYLTDEQYDAVIKRTEIENIYDDNCEINVYFNATLPEIDNDVTGADITAVVEYGVKDTEKRETSYMPLTDDERMIIKDKMNDYSNQTEGKGLNEMLQEANEYAKEIQEFNSSKQTSKAKSASKHDVER